MSEGDLLGTAKIFTHPSERRGERRGETNAKREAVLKLLRLRFDVVPETITRKVSAIRSLPRLDALFENAATVQTLDDIDWDN